MQHNLLVVYFILAAVAKSDGTRASVTSQVFSGAGITIPQSDSVTGKAIVISPQTGDTTAKDITVEIMKNNAETFFKSESVQ